jgi:hypothetical protein
MNKANAIVNRAKPAKARVHLAEVVVAKPSYKKSARQAASKKEAGRLSVAKAVSRAKLIPNVNSDEFRIVRMPG